MLIVI